MKKPYYKMHVFFCTNQREHKKACGNESCAQNARDYVKKRIKELALTAPGSLRISTAGCLGRCAEGPLCVIYSECGDSWYRYANEKDLEEIIQEHLIGGKIVEPLCI